jgi:hypothetical protein
LCIYLILDGARGGVECRTEAQPSLVDETFDGLGLLCFVNLGNTCVCKGWVRDAAFEVRVDRRRGKLSGEGVGVLCLGAVFARVVDELVNGGLRAVGIVAVLVSLTSAQKGVLQCVQIHVELRQLQPNLGVLVHL